MLSPTAGSAVTVATLLLFAWVGVRAGRRFGVADRDRYLSARGSQGTLSLALNFFASALGAWILFAPPEVGTFAGLLGVVGYAVGQALAIAVFAWLGPLVRERLPTGTTVLGFVRLRFGRLQHAYVGLVSVLYMFVFLAAELTAIGGVLSLLSGTDPLVPIAAVAAVTAAYTAYGGLPASLATDRWQAWIIMALVVGGAVAVAAEVGDPLARAEAAGLTDASRTGAEVGLALVIAIVAANLFHQGFWQRVWAARDRRSLVAGALGGGALIVPTVFLLGVAGMVAAGADGVETPSLAFFTLLEGLDTAALVLVVVLAVALVASTVDTLQNALTALVAAEVAGGRMGVGSARVVTVLLTLPAAAIAVEGLSVLRLFLVADLLAATIVFPVFLGLWRRTAPAAALAGAVAGLVAIVVYGWADAGTAREGFRLLTLPEGASLGPFVVAPAASASVTVLGSLLRRRSARGARPRPRSGRG